MTTPAVHPPPGAPPQAPSAQSPLALVSVIAGGLAWVVLPFLGALVAVVTGHLAKREIRASAGRLGGGALATVGLVLGYLQLVLATVALVALLWLLPRLFEAPPASLPEFEEALPEPFPDELEEPKRDDAPADPPPQPAPAPSPARAP